MAMITKITIFIILLLAEPLLVVTSSFRNIVILLTSLKIQNSETATNRRIKSIRSFTNYKMMKIVIFVVIAILGYVQAEWVRMEPSVTVFSGRHWRKLGKTDEDAPVKVVFALKHNQNTIQQLDQKLMEVSNPSSRNYGKYMTVNFFGLSFSFFSFSYRWVLERRARLQDVAFR
jgi:hypothetical protein